MDKNASVQKLDLLHLTMKIKLSEEKILNNGQKAFQFEKKVINSL